MPKKVLQITDFSGGLNAYSDAKDIKDNQFAQNWNAIVDKSGIIRVAGMGVDSISTDSHTSENFQKGYGLFQFNVDYSFNQIEGTFGTGISGGTIASSTSPAVGSFALQDIPSTSSVDDFYNNMIVYIYSGPNSGASRKITNYVASTRVITLNTNLTATPVAGDKYAIFRWTPSSDWKGITTNDNLTETAYNYITDGSGFDFQLGYHGSGKPNNRFIFSNRKGVTNETSDNLGYIEYNPKTSFQYTGVKINYGSGYSSGVTSLAVDGIAATEDIFLNRDIYKSDGTFIGTVTGVASVTSLTLSGGTAIALTDGDELYLSGIPLKAGVEYYLSFDCSAINKWTLAVSDGDEAGGGTNYSDKVPWVELYSPLCETEKGDFTSISWSAVSNWTYDSDVPNYVVAPSSTSGSGQGGSIHVTVADGGGGSGTPTYNIYDGGKNYAIGDTFSVTDPLNSARTVTITVTDINTRGLSLYKNNNWLSGDKILKNTATTAYRESNYRDEVDSNYIDNGDFEDGSAEWTTVGSNLSTTFDSQDYTGGDGTLTLTGTSDFSIDSGVPNTYIRSNSLNLHDNTPHNLNFVYDSDIGLLYAIYDVSNSQYLVNWTTLPPTRNSTESTTFRFANSDYTTPLSGINENHIDYITFITPGNPISTTGESDYRFYFSVPSVGTAIIHGITLDKAHNDLVSMGYKNPGSASPFLNEMKSWSNYYMRFKIPNDYTDSNDWTLRLYAGKYGWRTEALASLGVSDSQQVFFDNIKLTSEEGDTLTALVNNTNSFSEIQIYSKKTETWINDILSWNDVNSKPVYTYVNGMLKISDSNFDTNNPNKLMYYQDRAMLGSHIHDGWVTRDYAIASSPTINVRKISGTSQDNFIYNAFPYLNEHYKDQYWGTTDSVAVRKFAVSDSAADGAVTLGYSTSSEEYIDVDLNVMEITEAESLYNPVGWPMDAFGDIALSDDEQGILGTQAGVHNGLVIRHMAVRAKNSADGLAASYVDGPSYGTVAIADVPNHSSGIKLWLLDTKSVWFNDTIDPGGSPTSTTSKEVCLSNRGWRADFPQVANDMATMSEAENERIHDYPSCYIDGQGENANIDEKPRWPVQFLIDGNNSSNNFSITSKVDDIYGSVKSIRIKTTYLMTGKSWFCGTSPWTHYWDCFLPMFQFEVGKINTSTTVEDAENDILAGNFVSYATEGYKSKMVGETGSVVTPQSLANMNANVNTLELYDSEGNIDSFIQMSDGAWHVGRMSIKVGIDVEIFFSEGELSKNDAILVTMRDWYRHPEQGNMVYPDLGSAQRDLAKIFFRAGSDDHTRQKHLRMISPKNFTGYTGGNSYYSSSPTFNSFGDTTDSVDSRIPTGNPHQAIFATFFMKKTDITFYEDGVIESIGDESITAGSDSQVNFSFGPPTEEESLGWGGRAFKVAVSSLSILGEESALNEQPNQIGIDSDGNYDIEVGHCPSFAVFLGDGHMNDKFIAQTKFYMRDTSSDIYYLQFYIDHKDSKLHAVNSSKSIQGSYDFNTGIHRWDMNRNNFLDFNEINSYESETLVPQEDGISNENLTCRYKTSVYANNRLYVGNIYQNGQKYGDRMLKSPIGKYNIFPKSNFIDVAINDGDEIIALAYYKDKILQFKKRKVFVINISGDYEFLEDTFENVGVEQHCQVVTTPHGVVWANKYGCHLYDGKTLVNLIDNIIPETSDYATIGNNYWYASNYAGSTTYKPPVIGYVENRDTLIIKHTSSDVVDTTVPGGASYHFPTKSWATLTTSFSGNTAQTQSGNISNMVSDENGDILYYRFKSGDTTANNLIKKWNNGSYDAGGDKIFYFTTKDFTFGDVTVRKKIYKIYITYKTNSNTKVFLKTSINSANSFSKTFNEDKCKFQGTSTACYDSDTNGFLSTGDAWKTAEMRFTTASDFNNIYSLQIQFVGLETPADFEINDLSIVYRVKNIK